MTTGPSIKAQAWALFDRIVAEAAPDGEHTNPWTRGDGNELTYSPDFSTLSRLLGVPLHLRASTTTGAPALALDVWLAYELRRAGFEPDAVWPRAEPPRVLPAPIAHLLAKSTQSERRALLKRLGPKSPPAGVAANNANILGKNYVKQVDVGLSSWATGPEFLISTKRMDSSFGKNAANRVEESYGDAKNLRMRHPLAALGFVYGLRSTIFDSEPVKAKWLIDLLGKLGREDDAYHAVGLLVFDYSDELAADVTDDDDDAADPLVAAGVETDDDDLDGEVVPLASEDVLDNLPEVGLPAENVPAELRPARFLSVMVQRALEVTPINFHEHARELIQAAPRKP